MTVQDVTVAPDPRPTTWSLVREGLRGSKRNFTEGPIGSAIVVLAVPMVMEMCMESLFFVVDVFFVAKPGADAVATVGLTESMLAIVYTVAMALSIGATATVARRTGERDPEGAATTAFQVIVLGLIASTAMGLFGGFFARDLLRLMGATGAILEYNARFTVIMLGGCACIVLIFLQNAIFRGAGDAAVAMRVLWLANGINLILDPMLIFGVGPFPELGVVGASVATTTGRTTAVLIQFWVLCSGKARIHIQRRHMRLDPAVMWNICRLSGTGFLQVLLQTTSWIGLVRVISMFGSPALAGYTIGIRTIIFALLPSWGLSNAAATMVGQALGAGKPERAEKAVWTAGFYNMIFLGAAGVLFVVFAPAIVALFTADQKIAAHAIACLRIVASGYIFYAYGMVLTQSFNGAGDTWTPTWINFCCFWLWEIPLAWLLAIKLGLGPSGVYIAITIAFSTVAVVSAVLFRQGRWKLKRV
jgi:putative MATE family efflux protein